MRKPPSNRPEDVLEALGLPTGPPLHLERPGAAVAQLAPFLAPERLDRLREVLGQRTRHLTALLEHVHDAHNIAACIRSCDAFGLQDLHVVPQPGSSPRVNRMVATGAQRWLTIHSHPDTRSAVAALQAAGYRVLATDVAGSPPPLSPIDVPLADAPVCVAFGNEHAGVSDELLEAADGRVRIAMAGFARSLNISVAFAVVMHTLRGRLDRLDPQPQDARLPDGARGLLLDRWVLEDVKRARQVVAELVRRAQERPPD